jgi:hypothetical protein
MGWDHIIGHGKGEWRMSKVKVGRGPTACRLDYKRRLAVLWVTKFRPDVLALIEKEVQRKYPLVLHRTTTVLPSSLEVCP